MKGTLIYLETNSVDPRYNLAFEEYVLLNKREGDYLILWQNENTIVVGQNQNTVEEINSDFVDAHGIHVIRRSTGGGAVYHDLGNLNYSFITDIDDMEQMEKERFTEPIVRFLQDLGVQAEATGRNDILVEGKKISGTAQRIVKGRVLHHGTLLFDSDPEMISRALRVDPEKFRSKSIKSVKSRIGNIRDFLPRDMGLKTFWNHLRANLTGNGAEMYELNAKEILEVKKIKAEKYDTWEWNYGCSPEYTMKNKRFWNGGCLEVKIDVEHGVVKDIAFFGDFLSICTLQEFTKEFIGKEYSKEQFVKIVNEFPVERYFGTITAEEIIKTIFC